MRSRRCGENVCEQPVVRTRGEHQLTPVYADAVLDGFARDVSKCGATVSCGKFSLSSSTLRYRRAAASYARPASASSVKQPRCVCFLLIVIWACHFARALSHETPRKRDVAPAATTSPFRGKLSLSFVLFPPTRVLRAARSKARAASCSSICECGGRERGV